MKQAYKRLGLAENDPNIIEIATERKGKSMKRAGSIVFSIFFGLFGLFLLIATIALVVYAISSFFNEAITLSESILLVGLCVIAVPIGGGIGYLFFTGGFYWLFSKPAWYIALLTDSLHWAIYQEKKKKYKGHSLPIKNLQSLIILQRENLTYVHMKGIGPKEDITYRFSIHLEYKSDGEEQITHFDHPDGYNELNKIITYLQTNKNIPIFYAYAPGEMYNYESRDIKQLAVQTAREAIQFTGSLQDYEKKAYLRDVEWRKAMQATRDYMDKQKKNKKKNH